jgi:hypothetical protein
MKQALIAWIKADVTCAALVGTRVYSWPAPTGATEPYLTVTRVSSTQPTQLNAVAGWVGESWMIEVYAPTDLAAEPVAVALRNRLNCTGPQATLPYPLKSCIVQNCADGTFRDVDDGDGIVAKKTITLALKRTT